MAREAELRQQIIDLLIRHGPGKSICPSDAARALAGDDFRPLMDSTRQVAAQLAAEGRIEVTQKGRRVNLADVRGPVRLRLRET